MSSSSSGVAPSQGSTNRSVTAGSFHTRPVWIRRSACSGNQIVDVHGLVFQRHRLLDVNEMFAGCLGSKPADRFVEPVVRDERVSGGQNSMASAARRGRVLRPAVPSRSLRSRALTAGPVVFIPAAEVGCGHSQRVANRPNPAGVRRLVPLDWTEGGQPGIQGRAGPPGQITPHG